MRDSANYLFFIWVQVRVQVKMQAELQARVQDKVPVIEVQTANCKFKIDFLLAYIVISTKNKNIL